MKNFISLGILISLLLLVCLLLLLTIKVHTKNARNELARLAMGTIFLVHNSYSCSIHFLESLPSTCMRERGLCDLYVCMYIIIYVTPKSLNGTLAVDSPFQTLTVDFSLNL